MSSLDGTGLGVILAFYALVAGVGIWAGWRNRGKGDDHRNGHIVGARDINMGELKLSFYVLRKVSIVNSNCVFYKWLVQAVPYSFIKDVHIDLKQVLQNQIYFNVST